MGERLGLAALVVGVTTACGAADGSGSDAGAAGEPPTCADVDLDGPAGSSEPEARDDYEDRRATADLAALPEILDTSGLTDLDRAWLGYALARSVDELADVLDVASVPSTPMGQAVLAAFAVGQVGTLDGDFLRQAVHREYACDRDLPPTREDFIARYGDYTGYAARTVELSVPKRAPRAIYEDPMAGVYVAESDVDGGHETEVIVAGERPDAALDFFAYGADGRLVGWAELAVGSDPEVLPVPFTCALCHRNLLANTFSVVDPS